MFKNKNILVTGGTGSIGSEIVRKLLHHEPKVLRVLSNDENELFNLDQELQNYPNVRSLLGDVRDKERLRMAMEGVDLVFHAAALKHVPLCEYNPFEAVNTNVNGTQNLIEAARESEPEKFITISTDKAVNPINVMGATKLLVEKLTISANHYKGMRKTSFSCVRFGNVLNSRGSVFTLFREQIRNGGPVYITDSSMTRFIMTISSAVELTLKATQIAEGGEIFILKMPSLRITDLAEVMIDEMAPKYGYAPKDIRIETIGRRVGEKIHEELMTEDEAPRAMEIDDIFALSPERTEVGKKLTTTCKDESYNSGNQQALSKEGIKELLVKDGLL